MHDHTFLLIMCAPEDLQLYEKVYGKMDEAKFSVISGEKDQETITPNALVGTPDGILALVKGEKLNFEHLKYFILDECDEYFHDTGTCSLFMCDLIENN